MNTNKIQRFALTLVSACGIAVHAEVPTYSVDVVTTFTQSTTIRGASDTGLIVGDQIVNGVSRAFVASQGNGLTLLPHPNGATSSIAMDVNNNGVIVGAVHGGGFVVDGGEPAIWVPDGSGGYTPYVPEQFESQPSPLGELPINGGLATAVNDAGVVVGWSRYQGFQGGPTTLFSIDQPPVNLGELGFQATVEDINNNNIAVGGNYIFDLNTNTATHIGIPDPVGTVGFTHVLGYTINDNEQVVAAAHIATASHNQWVTYIFDGIWSPLYPNQIGSRYVGNIYDNNNQGDVSAWGGVYFATEDQWFGSYDSLIDPTDQNWDTAIGYVGNDRRVYTTAYDSSADTYAVVVLVPDTGVCEADMTADGELNFLDISAFLSSFSSGDLSVDMDQSGSLNFLDVSAFLSLFSDGCP